MLQTFKIHALFGKSNVTIEFSKNALIIIGPNGAGKSTVVNIIYYTITRQWQRLSEFKFDSISFTVKKRKFKFDRDDLIQYTQTRSMRMRMRSRYQVSSRVVERALAELQDQDMLDAFLESDFRSVDLSRRYSAILNVPTAMVRNIQNIIKDKYSPELFDPVIFEINDYLKENFPEKVMFLPTYRRIEKDLKFIMPDFEEQFEEYMEREIRQLRRQEHFMQLVSFGMEDVKRMFSSTLDRICEYARGQLSNLAGSYLRDVIRGSAAHFDPDVINSLSDDRVSYILSRVEEASLSSDEKKLIQRSIMRIKNKSETELKHDERYLAHYFTKLIETSDLIEKRAKSILIFVDICNKYLEPSKRFIYDDVNYRLNLIDKSGEALDISDLSSGEKQIISLFSHLYLEHEGPYFIIIDEPELSLSVPWQKSFLPDIVNSGDYVLYLAGWFDYTMSSRRESSPSEGPISADDGEIEVTPEMVEAGLDELWNHNIMEPMHDEMRVAVASIYRVMFEARPEHHCRSVRFE